MAYGNDKAAISQASAKGKVKWFNATKGYGFITLDNGGDAFCHASALQATGHSDVQPGTTIICDLADSQRGLQVVTVHSVDISTAEAPSRGPRRDFGGGGGYGGGRDFGGGGGGRDFGGGGGLAATIIATTAQRVRWSKARSSSSTTRRALAL